MTTDICDRLLRVELANVNFAEKLDLHRRKSETLSDKLDVISAKQQDIFNMVLAIKWALFGCVSLLVVQNMGLLTYLKGLVL